MSPQDLFPLSPEEKGKKGQRSSRKKRGKDLGGGGKGAKILGEKSGEDLAAKKGFVLGGRNRPESFPWTLDSLGFLIPMQRIHLGQMGPDQRLLKASAAEIVAQELLSRSNTSATRIPYAQ